jgi:hypothetical protein
LAVAASEVVEVVEVEVEVVERMPTWKLSDYYELLEPPSISLPVISLQVPPP